MSNLSDLLRNQATRRGKRDFLLFGRQASEAENLACWRQTLSYAELDARVDRACQYLAALAR